jgi:cytochrome b561
VNPLRFLVDAFVNTFGITQPTPETEAKAGRFIALMLVAVLLFLVAVGWLLRAALTH